MQNKVAGIFIHRAVHLDSCSFAILDNRYSTLQGQLIKTKTALDDNRVALDETTSRVRERCFMASSIVEHVFTT